MAVKYEIYDDQLDEDGDGGAATPSIDIMSPVTLDDITTPMVNDEDAASSVANEDMEFDENLAAELAQGLEELEEDDEDEDESEESEDEDQPNNERAMQMKLLGEEIAEIERTIKKKRVDLDSAPNPIIRRRFEDIIQRLQSELDAKKEQLAQFHKETEEEQQQHQQQQQQHQQEEGDGSNQ
ncbi:hypothetical protein GGI12_004680 [Dipsacomyces acuminosporus]|nr:hypothetical protein GGI12_004680 [Dipsacomyces acuminosporus]